MSSSKFETVSLQTTSRYLRQNMDKAMRGDVVRGLVELITNADDSYKRIEERRLKAHGGIVVEVERRQSSSTIIVRDRAEGMTYKEMKLSLARMGELTSGFKEGGKVRGLHGRGAKDVAALGVVNFESIKNDEYTRLTIDPNDLDRIQISTEKATDSLKEELSIKKSGTIVTIDTHESVRVPLHETLQRNLSNYYSLRDINSNPSRKLILKDVNQKREDRIIYKYPENGEIVFNEVVAIPDVPDATANIQIKVFKRPFERSAPSSPYRDGILVKSVGAIHDCQYFGLESEPLAWRFSGEVTSAHVDKLIDEYERAEKEKKHIHSNPIRILNPDRDGLISEHPFTKALYGECQKTLSYLIDKIKKEESTDKKDVANGDLLKKLEDLSREISPLFEDELKELGEVESHDIGNLTKELPPGLHIIPGGDHELRSGQKKTFSVYYVDYNGDFTLPVKVVSNNNKIKVNKTYIYLDKDPLNSSMGKNNFTVEALEDATYGRITVEYRGVKKSFNIKVVEVEDLFQKRDGLFFSKEKYYLRYGKPKKIEVFLKSDKKVNNLTVRLISSKPSDISVLKGGVNNLRYTAQQNLYKATFEIEGRRKQASGVITAMVEDIESVSANVLVTDRDQSGINFNFEPSEDDFGATRYKWDQVDKSKLLIGAKHKSIRRYLGEPKGDIYPGINSPLYFSVLAEVIAEALAFNLLERAFNHEGEGSRLDYSATDYYYHQYFSKFLGVAHKCLIEQDKIDMFFEGDVENKKATI